jgi:hypothetical protein
VMTLAEPALSPTSVIFWGHRQSEQYYRGPKEQLDADQKTQVCFIYWYRRCCWKTKDVQTVTVVMISKEGIYCTYICRGEILDGNYNDILVGLDNIHTVIHY